VSGVRGRIVFVCFDGRDDEICLMNSDGSRLTQLTDNEVGDFYPSLSPDGRYIFFARQIRGSNYEIFRMNTDGADVVQLTSNGAQNYAPDLSPDGARLVFTSTQGGRGQQVWVMNGDGSQATQLTTEGENIDPAWSPNGGFITFASNRSGSRQIWIMNADGSDPRQITDGSDLGGRHSLAPDGSTLAFYAGRREDLSRNVYLIRVDGTDLRQLTSGGDNLAPSFSPDGEWIAFTSARDGDNDIYLMRADGADVVNLTNDGRSNYQPRWGP
jgi:Tol biopolymer transport system component